MPGDYRIRVRVKDGKKLKYGKVKANLGGGDLHVHDTGEGLEFVICATKPEGLERVRSKLADAGLKEVPGSTDVGAPPPPPPLRPSPGPWQGQGQMRPPASRPGGQPTGGQPHGAPLPNKPYAFIPLPNAFSTAEPVWHDGTCSKGRLSGEIRFELENLTPLLAGWERRTIGEDERLARAVKPLYPDGNPPASKSVLCPLRAPWGERPVIIPGDSLKGLLRHELGALLGAPMERVAERSYSYRPNSLYPKPGSRLIPRLARVPKDGVVMRELRPGEPVRVPATLELLREDLKYDRKNIPPPPRYQFDPSGGRGEPYRGGLGAGVKLNARRNPHTRLEADPPSATSTNVPLDVQNGYLNTLRHLTDLDSGHFSERHPDVPEAVTGQDARSRILHAAKGIVFSPGDLVWVEWDTKQKRIVSIGWHYYYRWAYQDTVRQTGSTSPRPGLHPLAEEVVDGTAKDQPPAKFSAVRSLFGYTGDNDGSRGIGSGDYSQLMGRIAVNAALEVVPANGGERFLPPVFLKELGMPRPSAVEFYLEQPHYPNSRPGDSANLVTYGDAAGYDAPGRLCGRKFYLDRSDAYTGKPWEDGSTTNRLNDRSTLAMEASQTGRRFRFTLRFRDLDSLELSSVLLALCPHQWRNLVGGPNPDDYCSKLGYARPLGWGTVRIEAKELHLLKQDANGPRLEAHTDIAAWFRQHFKAPPLLQVWLKIHRAKNPDAGDYPRSQKDGQIYTFHTTLRADHSRLRRY